MADQIYRLTLNWNIAGQFASTILHYKFDDVGYPTTQAAAIALVNKWDATSKGAWLNFLPNVTLLLSAKGRKATGTGGFEAVKVYSSGNAGTRSGEISAAGVNPVLIHFPVQQRRGRGKTFLPGCREADIKDGIFTDDFVSAINANKNTAFSDLTLVGGGAPVASFVVKTKSASPGSWAVLDTILSDMVGQQRRRQRPS